MPDVYTHTAAELSVIHIRYSGRLSFNFRPRVAPILKINKTGLCQKKVFFFLTFSFPSIISLTNFAYELYHNEIGEELIR